MSEQNFILEEELTIEKILFNEYPITINRTLAKCMTLTEAVIFQQIHYWLQQNKKKDLNFIDGRYWTYNSTKEWHESDFDFLSESTIKRTLVKLEKDGLLITANYNKIKMDRTKWYSINYENLINFCQKRLSEKQLLALKRKEAGIKGVQVKKQKNNEKNPCNPSNEGKDENVKCKTASCSNSKTASCFDKFSPDCFERSHQVASKESTSLVQPIPETTIDFTETSTEKGSSKGDDSPLISYFEKNICKLKTAVLPQFYKILSNYDPDFLKEIIKYGAETGAKGFNWFVKVVGEYEDKNILTAEGVREQIEKFREEKKQAKIRSIEEKNFLKQLKDDSIESDFASHEAFNSFCEDDIEIDLSDAVEDKEFKENLEKNVDTTNINYRAWLATCKYKKLNNNIYIVCPNNLTKVKVEEKYYDILLKICIESGINRPVVISENMIVF